MIVLITGGNDNGKSEYAEDMVIRLSPGATAAGYTRCYLATMSARDEESLRRIDKHIFRRKNMEYITIEQNCDIGKCILNDSDCESSVDTRKILLIEDIPNLLANEMFKDGEFFPDVHEKIIRDIKKLISMCEHTVIVTNEVFSDGIVYDEYTTAYCKELGSINTGIALISDKVVELVCGIPVIVKDVEI